MQLASRREHSSRRRQFTSQKVLAPVNGQAIGCKINAVEEGKNLLNIAWILSDSQAVNIFAPIENLVQGICYRTESDQLLSFRKSLDTDRGIAWFFANHESVEVYLSNNFGFYVIQPQNRGSKLQSSFEPQLSVELSRLSNAYLMITERLSEPLMGELSKFFAGNPIDSEDALSQVIRDYDIKGPIGLFANRVEPSVILPNQYISAAYLSSNPGTKRESNEDVGMIVTLDYSVKGVFENFCLMNVADGVGGLELGEVASKIASTEATSQVIKCCSLNNEADFAQTALSAFRSANEKIEVISETKSVRTGSTLSFALVRSGLVNTAFAGDTRIYLIKLAQRQIIPLSRDHKLNNDKNSHVITRALGTPSNEPEMMGPVALTNNSMVLICSDGLSDLVSDSEILDYSLKNANPKVLASSLTSLANSRGGHDNITLAILANRVPLGQ